MKTKFKTKIVSKAAEDIVNIVEYIEKELFNPKAAKNILVQLQNAINNISDFPYSYPLVENEFIKEKIVRKAPVGKYIIFYLLEDNEVFVLRVISGMKKYYNIL